MFCYYRVLFLLLSKLGLNLSFLCSGTLLAWELVRSILEVKVVLMLCMPFQGYFGYLAEISYVFWCHNLKYIVMADLTYVSQIFIQT